jgi:hypothetical protein
MINQKRITLATFKSFIKKNKNIMFIMQESSFDGMTDCVEFTPRAQRKFVAASESTAMHPHEKHNFGYYGIWLVGSSRDYFSSYDDGIYEGINYSNCCGSGTIAIKKQSLAA